MAPTSNRRGHCCDRHGKARDSCRAASFAAADAGVVRPDYSLKSQTIALSSIDRQTPDYHSSIQSAKL
jgi:hypothetical protein